MSLINLQTNLKSLKFGNDQFDGGSSNQPYIQTDIPDEFGEYGFLNQDFILRGGSKAVTDSLIDVKRLGKYFTDTKNPSGFLFTVKQNLLSRLAVKTQASGLLNEGIYTPLSTLIQAGGVAFGLHVNKQGLNPFNGESSIGKYSEKISNEIFETLNSPDGILKNRLYALYESKIQNGVLGGFAKENNISPFPTDILTYGGGPGSILGIGNTNIKFADQRTGLNNPELKNSGFFKTTYAITSDGQFGPQNSSDSTSTLDYSVFKRPLITINGNKLLGLSNIYLDLSLSKNSGFDENGSINPFIRNIGQLDLPDSALFPNINPHSLGSYTYSQDDLENIPTEDIGKGESFYIGSGKQGQVTTPGDFRQKLRNTPNQDATKNIGNLANAPDYTEKNIEQRVNLGDPGNRNQKNLNSYVSGARVDNPTVPLGAASSGSYDKINISPIYLSDGLGGLANFKDEKNDLVKFAISVIDTKTNNVKNIHFRAFLNQISDAYTADWDSTQYIGRGEKFYTYKGFDRKVSLSWTVAAQSKAELIPMYKKLNYLASICAPNYNGNGYMAGNITRLTVGGYLFQQPGIITGFSYEMNDDNATWEIGIPDNNDASPFYDSSVKELPHLIKVTGFNFIPIHEFVPRLAQEPNSGTKERFIALANGMGLSDTNYI
jgi:hypothetical protein